MMNLRPTEWKRGEQVSRYDYGALIADAYGIKLCDNGTIDLRSWHKIVQPGNALLYLYRRFGPPGPDDYEKRICGYWLATDDPDLDLEISIGYNVSIYGYITNEDLGYQYIREQRDNTPLVQEVHRKTADAVLDLLRPAQVRDVYINILGRAEAFLDDYAEAEIWHEWVEAM